jgi:hypothetical protein
MSGFNINTAGFIIVGDVRRDVVGGDDDLALRHIEEKWGERA